MKKIFSILILLFLFSGVGFGQRDSGKNAKQKPIILISIEGGIGIPVGGFSGTTDNTGSSNFSGVHAINGETININFSKSINRMLSFVGRLNFNTNYYEDPGCTPNGIDYIPEYDQGSTSFQEYGALFGIMLSANTKPAIDLRLLIGADRYTSPEIKYYAYGYGYLLSQSTVDIHSIQGNALAFDFGCTTRFQISKRLFIPLDFDFYYSAYHYSINYTVTYNYQSPSTTINYYTSQKWFIPVSVFNITTGIGFKF